jgi:hypothetical protein
MAWAQVDPNYSIRCRGDVALEEVKRTMLTRRRRRRSGICRPTLEEATRKTGHPKSIRRRARPTLVNRVTKQSQWHPPADQSRRDAITADNFQGFSASGTSHLRP